MCVSMDDKDPLSNRTQYMGFFVVLTAGTHSIVQRWSKVNGTVVRIVLALIGDYHLDSIHTFCSERDACLVFADYYRVSA